MLIWRFQKKKEVKNNKGSTKMSWEKHACKYFCFVLFFKCNGDDFE